MTTPIKSHDTTARCECTFPFPLRLYFVRAGEQLEFRAGDTFLITCRCGRTYPLAAIGNGAPQLEPKRPYSPPEVTPLGPVSDLTKASGSIHTGDNFAGSKSKRAP